MTAATTSALSVKVATIPHAAPRIPGAQPPSVLALNVAFRCLPEQDRQALLRWSVIRNIRRQETVFRQGEPGRAVLVVIEGFVKLTRNLEDREPTLDVVGPGQCFGEVAVLNRWPHDTDATALSNCRLLSIDGRQFAQLLDGTRHGQAAVLQLLSERLRRMTEHAADALGLPAPARLAKALLHLSSLQSTSLHRPHGIPLRLSQSELGAMAGLTRESVNKILGGWRDNAWIQLAGGNVTVIDVQALSDLLGERDIAHA